MRTTEQVLHQQQYDAERDKQPPAPKQAVAPAPTTSTAITPSDNRAARMRYLDEIAGGMPGRLIRFNIKENKYTFVDDGGEVPDVDYIALCPETWVGFVKFHEDDLPPERFGGLLYDGYRMPSQDELPDRDQATWKGGLSGLPEDPWRHQMALPIMNAATQELLVFTVLNDTGRRAVGRLLQHFERMLRLTPNELPIIRLTVGGFNHRDPRVGWVSTPQLAIVGRIKRDTVAKTASLPADEFNGSIPH
jgi:hypothetical protein